MIVRLHTTVRSSTLSHKVADAATMLVGFQPSTSPDPLKGGFGDLLRHRLRTRDNAGSLGAWQLPLA
jgi:hypothetical protein